MDELKQLKTQWAQQTIKKQFTKDELNSFLQKKSKSSIQWIFYLSLIEFVLYITLPLLLPNYFESFDYYRTLNLYEFAIATTVVGYVLLLYFMYRFFKNYQRISISDSVKDHLSTILNTRKAVNQYILYNLGVLFVFSCVVLVYAFRYDENLAVIEEKHIVLVTIALCVLIIGIVLGLLGSIYYLVYGPFLRPLKRNEKELKKIV
ncbi:MAG: hypothetical protein ACPH63_04425 [Flavobacteriaceae bacterium]